jgi:hypothetical protein
LWTVYTCSRSLIDTMLHSVLHHINGGFKRAPGSIVIVFQFVGDLQVAVKVLKDNIFVYEYKLYISLPCREFS